MSSLLKQEGEKVYSGVFLLTAHLYIYSPFTLAAFTSIASHLQTQTSLYLTHASGTGTLCCICPTLRPDFACKTQGSHFKRRATLCACVQYVTELWILCVNNYSLFIIFSRGPQTARVTQQVISWLLSVNVAKQQKKESTSSECDSASYILPKEAEDIRY